MNYYSRYFFLLVSFAFPLFFTNCDNSKAIRLLRVGHVLDTNSPVHKAMIFFGEKLEDILLEHKLMVIRYLYLILTNQY